MKNKQKILRDLLIGMLGTAFLMGAEWLIFALGKGNEKNGLIQTGWAKMPMWRFEISMLLCAAGVALLAVGLHAAVQVVNASRRRGDVASIRMAKLFHLSANAALIGFLFWHAVNCMLPVIYKSLFETSLMGAEILTTVENVFYVFAIPFYVYRIVAYAGITVSVVYFVLVGRLRASKSMLLLNPGVMLAIGYGLKFLKNPQVTDFAAAFGSFGFLFMLSGMIRPVSRKMEREADSY